MADQQQVGGPNPTKRRKVEPHVSVPSPQVSTTATHLVPTSSPQVSNSSVPTTTQQPAAVRAGGGGVLPSRGASGAMANAADIPRSNQFDNEMAALLQNFTKDQEERFNYYRRTRLPAQKIRRMMEPEIKEPVSEEMVVIMGGVAKMFLGEVVELAKEIQTQWGDSGPLAPCHVKEAYRRLQRSEKMMTRGYLGP